MLVASDNRMTGLFYTNVIRSKMPRRNDLGQGRSQIDLRGQRLAPIRLTMTNGKRRLNFTDRADALAEAPEIKGILLTHGSDRLNDVAQFVSNGDLNRYAGLVVGATLEPFL
jgi:hypothetical protein